MQEKIVKTNLINEKAVIDKHLIFEWKCLERKQENKTITLKFQRDDSVPYIKELEQLELEYGDYKLGSMIPAVALPCAALVLLTIFLICFITMRDNFNFLVYFLSFNVPALLCVVGGFIFMFLRVRAIGRLEKEKPLKDIEYKEKVAKLK